MDELQNIQDMVFELRGQRVMLDFDFAKNGFIQPEEKDVKTYKVFVNS